MVTEVDMTSMVMTSAITSMMAGLGPAVDHGQLVAVAVQRHAAEQVEAAVAQRQAGLAGSKAAVAAAISDLLQQQQEQQQQESHLDNDHLPQQVAPQHQQRQVYNHA